MTQNTLQQQHASLGLAGRGAVPLLERVCIHATATAPLLEVTVEQHYVNASRSDVEVVYTFPVPARAVLLGLEFVLGERTLSGIVGAKRQATAAYDRAVEQGDSAVLVEAQRDGLYTANLGNLRPGEHALIRLHYGQLLTAQGDDWRVAIPTVLAPFYGCAEADGGLDARVAPTQSLTADYPLALTLTVAGADAAAVRCTSHEASISASDGTDGVVARLPGSARLDRDVVFLVRRPQAGAAASALCGRDGDRAVVVATTVLRAADVAPLPVSVRLVLDCSGSMAGESMDWAAVGCQRLVEGLHDADEFSVTRFGSDVDHWMRRLVRASPANRAEFGRRLLDVTADLGGTEMEQALKSAAALRGARERSEIVLLTDGEIWASDALVRWARTVGVRVFVIGVGAAPNQPFLSRLAQETGGSCEFVTPGEDMLRAVERVLARLRQPRREALAVTWPATPDWTLQLPAVAHAGETVHVMAGFEAAPVGDVAIDGNAAALPGRKTDDESLARIVAWQRLLSGDFADPAATAEHYQLVSEWTSLVAVLERADADKASGLPQIAQVDHMLAAGWGGTGMDAPAIWRSRAVALSCAAPAAACSEEPAIPTFLRSSRSASLQDDTLRDLLSTDDYADAYSATEPAGMRRSEAARHRRDDLARWIRAINRRMVVEVTAEQPGQPTVQWLAACVSAQVAALLDDEVRNGVGEQALVAAFIAALGDFEDEAGERLSVRARHWIGAQRSASGDGDAAAAAAVRVLDAVLLGEDRRPVAAGDSDAAVRPMLRAP